MLLNQNSSKYLKTRSRFALEIRLETIKFLREGKSPSLNILIIVADKGNSTGVLDVVDFNSNVH